MRDVKNSGGTVNSEMFIDDAGILDRHFPATKINQARAQFLVRFIKCSSFEHVVSIQEVSPAVTKLPRLTFGQGTKAGIYGFVNPEISVLTNKRELADTAEIFHNC